MRADFECEEVVALLLHHFSGVSDLENGWLGFGREPGWLLKVRQRGDRLTDAELGPELTDDKTTVLLKELDVLDKAEVCDIRTAVSMMSEYPVPGCFRSGAVQIRPAGEESLHPSASVARPFILELKAQLPRRPGWLRDLRAGRLAHEKAWALSVLLGGAVWLPRQVMRHHWVTTIREGEVCPEVCQEHWFEPHERGFESLAPEDKLPTVPSDAFYVGCGRPSNSPLPVPDDLADLLETLDHLEGGARRRFVRASCWFNSAIAHQHVSRTVAYLGLVNAIEAMLDSKPAGPSCTECGRPIGPGPTRAFRDFLEEHVARLAASRDPSGLKRERRRLYEMRSKMLHQGFQLDSELAPWRQPPHTFQQLDTFFAAYRNVTIALVEWLRRQAVPGLRDCCYNSP